MFICKKCQTTYEETISHMYGDRILDLDWYNLKLFKWIFIFYSPLTLHIRKKKTFFSCLNHYVIQHRWQLPQIKIIKIKTMENNHELSLPAPVGIRTAPTE
jgi:hypothetical protein